LQKPVIVSACRTAMGKFGRSLVGVHAAKLGATAARAAVERAGLRAFEVDEVVMGNVISAGLGQNVARQVAIYSGIPVDVGSMSVNMVCGSGMKAVMLAAQAIKAGDAEIVVAGGTESMSNSPYLVREMRWGNRYGDSKLEDAMIFDGLWDVYNQFHMGVTGERIAKKYDVTRKQADEYAYESQMRATKAQRAGTFREEIVPVELLEGNKGGAGAAATGEGTETKHGSFFAVDECIRSDTTLEGLARLKPAFLPEGVLTAGNSSQLSDGASALVIMSQEGAKERGLSPLAEVVAYGAGGTMPEDVMEAPIPTVKALLKRSDLSIEDVDLVEYNEAYSSSSIVVRNELGVPEDRFNVNGGAVALGHPIGCSGARILTSLAYELRRRGKTRGLATLCLGGGNALAMLIERR
jgi:acetyl-CoA C-acetyltransferase